MKIDNSQQVLDFVDSHASQKFISENCLYLTRSGSKSYNTHIESSDDDIKGVTLAPKNYHYGFLNNFEQYEHKDPDIVIYGLQKYTQLAVNNNPNMLETLYVDVGDILYMHPAFEKLMSIRDEALSKRAYHTFTGYARGQMQRLNNHKHWIDNPLVEPKIEDYGIVDNKKYKALYQLVASEIKLEIDKSYFNDFQNQMEMTHAFYSVLTEWKLAKDKIWESHLERFVGTGDVYSQIVKYKNYDKDLKNYKKYMTWKNERNPKRAEQEIKLGYCSKFAYHIVRLLTMSKEILTDHKVSVKRVDDRDLYIDIRNGKYNFDEFKEMTNKLIKQNDEAFKTCTLPDLPNFKKFDDAVVTITEELC